jgi:hypothetical protein
MVRCLYKYYISLNNKKFETDQIIQSLSRVKEIKVHLWFQVAKNRYSGDLGVMPLEFDKSSLSYAQKKKKVPDESNTPDQT